MANLLGSFLASGGNLTPDDINPGATDDAVSSSLRRWQGRGRPIPFGMTEAQFREYVRRVRERPGQQNAILAEMGFAGAGNDVRPTTRGMTPLPLGSDGTAVPPPLPETGGGPGAATALGNFADAFRTPPNTTTAENPFTAPPPPMTEPPPTTADATRYVPPFPEGTVNREPNPLWADIGRSLRNFGNSETGPDGRVNPISQGLLAGLGPPLPPPQTGWLSNPLGQRPPQRRPRTSTGMFG